MSAPASVRLSRLHVVFAATSHIITSLSVAHHRRSTFSLSRGISLFAFGHVKTVKVLLLRFVHHIDVFGGGSSKPGSSCETVNA